MDKRYQVFVSSTFEDLKDERKVIVQYLLNAKYIPTGMEMFSASNDEQFEYIKKILDNCDYYVLVIGARYGSMNPNTGISFTEQEYDYAISKGIPVLAFLISDPEKLADEKREDDKKEQLEAFKKKVSATRMCKMWSNINDLVTSVIISLTQEVSENPQLGWTRGTEYDSTELLSQINTLRLEKEQLEKETLILKKIINDNSVKTDNLASGNSRFRVYGKTVSSGYGGYHEVLREKDLSWDQIFSAIGPYLVSPKDYYSFESELVSSLNSAYSTDLSEINNDCIQTIKIHLNALGLIDVSAAQSVKGGVIEYIELTPKGKQYLINLKAIKNHNYT